MRRIRRVFLLILILVAGAVGWIFYEQKRTQATQKIAPPKSLPDGMSMTAQDWQWAQEGGDKPKVHVSAKNFRQMDNPPRFELEKVELKIFHKGGQEYDLVKSEKAEFKPKEGLLFSDGDVEITMAVPVEDKPRGRVVMIRSSGVTFDSNEAKASTDRATSFAFDTGSGKSIGAVYDSTSRELILKSAVELNWKGKGKDSKPMKIESGNARYSERDAKVYLEPWSKMTRDTLILEAGKSVVTLAEGEIQLVEAENARGVDKFPKREIQYSANHLTMNFGEGGIVEKLIGEGNGHILALSAAGSTDVKTDRIDLLFDTTDGESTLRTALANGHSVMESKPAVRANVQTPATRILRSDTINTIMRPGGEEIERVETHSAGTLEFIPNRPGDRFRRVEGERFYIAYGEQNKIQTFRSVTVKTLTQAPPPQKGKPAQPDAVTTSRDMLATFDPKSGQLAKIEQWNDFRYEEGTRKASAERAVLEQTTNKIALTGVARMVDDTGSTAADRILLEQTSGDMTAEGHVSSTRLPDKSEKKKKTTNSSMLEPEEAVQAKADRMTVRDSNTQITYAGNAIMWQGSNRIQANNIQIDRDDEKLIARGAVVSTFLDKPKEDTDKKKPAKKPSQPLFTVVRAAEMIYTDEDKLSYYKGGVELTRPNLKVTSKELRAFLKKDDSSSTLEKAYADGDAVIVQKGLDRTRRGTGEHLVYDVAEEKVTLEGGSPLFVDSLKGTTRGQKLTWFSNDDRLIVDGIPAKPAVSVIKRKLK
jgi:lipopolysaccharide export system protein LptA